VEVLFPIEQPEHIKYLREQVLQNYFCDNLRARSMQSAGEYKRLKPKTEEQGLDIQDILMRKR
jgi:polyphosphate kinase